jgi:hypothetical protein
MHGAGKKPGRKPFTFIILKQNGRQRHRPALIYMMPQYSVNTVKIVIDGFSLAIWRRHG